MTARATAQLLHRSSASARVASAISTSICRATRNSASPDGVGPHGPRADQQHPPDARLERLDALADRRRRDIQACGPRRSFPRLPSSSAPPVERVPIALARLISIKNISWTKLIGASLRVSAVARSPPYFAGLLFSLSLIVAIGAQNAYVLRQGARRIHVKTCRYLRRLRCRADRRRCRGPGRGGPLRPIAADSGPHSRRGAAARVLRDSLHGARCGSSGRGRRVRTVTHAAG